MAFPLFLLLLPSLSFSTETISLRLWSADTQTCYDYSGHDNHAVSGSTAGVDLATDVVFRQAGAVFSGSGAVLTLPPNPVNARIVQVDSAFTVAVWVWLTALEGTVVERVETASTLFALKLAANSVVVTVMDTSSSFNCPQLAVDTWFLLVATVSDTSLSVSLNGVSPGPIPTPLPFLDSPDSTFHIGISNFPNSPYFQGVIYEFRWFDTALTPANMSQLYALPGSTCISCSTMCSINPVSTCLPVPGTIGAAVCPVSCSPATLSCEMNIHNACFYTGSDCDPTCFTCFSSLSTACDTCKDANAVRTPIGGLSGSCACAPGFYSPSAGTCSPCFYGCLTCTNSGNNDCESCLSPATLSSSSTCDCPALHYMSGVGICKLCTATCSACSGDTVTDCTNCWANAEIEGGALFGACECGVGFYGTAENCLICSGECLECSGPDNMQCLACKTAASLIGTHCECDPGFYPSTDPSNCLPCAPTCGTCVSPDPSLCHSCNPNAHLTSPPISPCTCSPGYYPDPDPVSCLPCSKECQTCSGLGASLCTSCKLNAGLVAGLSSACECDPGFVGTPDDCQSCDTTCLTCMTALPSGCASCKPNAQLYTGTAPDSCICLPGFYPSPSPANCVLCDLTCATCGGPGASGCLSCISPAVLSGLICSCPIGYFANPTAQLCTQCYISCRTCTGLNQFDCLSCKDPSISPAAGLCPCGNNQYLLASGLCGNCHSSCKSCSAGSFLDCMSCFPHASFISSEGCVCDSGFTGLAQACLQCLPHCLTCSVPSICLSCKANAHILPNSPGTCTCFSSFYPAPDAGSCSPCDSSCLECSLGDALSCLQCYPNAQLSTAMPSSCVCFKGYVAWSSVSTCALCHISCVKCVVPGIATSCLECYSNAELIATAPAECNCLEGFYPNGNASLCVLCPNLCASCNDAISGCLSCKPHSAFQGAYCICQPGYYLSLSQYTCEPCHPTCLTCISGLAQACLSCAIHSSLSSTSPSACICDFGYIRQGDLLLCLPALCDIGCTACSSTGTCLGCYSNAEMRTNSQLCHCQKGHFPDPNPSNCSPCDQTCETCTSRLPTDCVSCYKSAELKYGNRSECQCRPEHYPDPNASHCSKCPPNCLLCYTSRTCSQCSIGFFPTGPVCHRCEENCLSCLDSQTCQVCALPAYLTLDKHCKECPTCPQPLQAQIYGPFQSTYNITFTRPISCPFYKNSLKVSTIPESSIDWTVKNEGNLTVTVAGGPWANISFVNIAILVPVWDEFGYSLENNMLEAAPPVDYTSDYVLNAAFINTSVEVTAAVAVALASGSAVLTGGGLGMALLSQMQYFSYISTSNYTVTSTLTSFYTNLNQKSLLPNWFQRDLKSDMSPSRLLSRSEELLELEDFLDSAGQYVTVLLGLCAVHVIVGIGSLWLGKWVRRVKAGFVWSVYMWFWYFAYLDLTISALIHVQTQYAVWTSYRLVISNILAFITLVFTAITPILACFLVISKRDYLFSNAENHIKDRFSALVPGIRSDRRRAQFFIPIYYFQRLIYAFLVVFLRDFTKIQALSFLFPCGIMLFFVLFCQPLTGLISRILHIISEIDTLLVFSLLCFSIFQSSSLALNWVIFTFTVKAFICTICLAGLYVVRVVRRRWRRSKQIAGVIRTESLFGNRGSTWMDEGKGESEGGEQKGDMTQRSDLTKD